MAKSSAAFDKLNETADAIKVAQWEAQYQEAQQRRNGDPSAMDVLEVQLRKGEPIILPSNAEIKKKQHQHGNSKSWYYCPLARDVPSGMRNVERLHGLRPVSQ